MGANFLKVTLLWCVAVQVAWAGQYVLLVGQANTVPVAARVVNGETRCNLRISVPGQADAERLVEAPFFDAAITITPQDLAPVTVRWQGQSRRLSDQVVNACPTQGETSFKVVNSNALTRAVWLGMQAQLAPNKVDCLRIAFELNQVRPEWFDFNDSQPSGEDAKINRSFAQCEAFLVQPLAWGTQSPQGHACTVAGVQTRCEGFYTASLNGKVQNITREAAIRRQLQNLAWGSAVREVSSVKSSRLQKENDRVARASADEAAQIQALADAQLQTERQAQALKAAEQRALQDRIMALKAQIAEEKVQAAQDRHWIFKQIDKIKGVPTPDAKLQEDPKAAAPAVPVAVVPAARPPPPAAPTALAAPQAPAAAMVPTVPTVAAAPLPAAVPAMPSSPAASPAARSLPPLPPT